MLKSKFDFKDGVDSNDLMLLDPKLMILFANFLLYCNSHDLPVTITSAVDAEVPRVSTTHKDGRALDVSVKGWTDQDVLDAVEYFNHEFSYLAAISFSDHMPRAIIYHDVGHGRHLHLQVRR